MQTWTRATRTRLCGHCGALIAVGEPIVLLTLPTTTLQKVRCAECSGGAPPDLPLKTVKAEAPATSSMTSIRGLADDWKQRAAADREPGEEG